MAKITQHATLAASATFSVDEEEMRALDAMVGYGYTSFIDTFKKHMGSHYMSGHEDGLKRFFESIRGNIPRILGRTDDAREVFEGTKLAVHPPKDA